ncbi:MAG: hypothetical protein NT004_10970 [Bacteroidetes bacterium]|nr:hypothetical protein [Bacteroidota bacterium]
MKKYYFIGVLFLLILGCNQTKNNWIKAKQSNSIAEVKKFLKENPSSEFDSEAKIFLDSLIWEVVKKSNSVDSIQMFIATQPNLTYVAKAKASIDTLKKPILIPFKFDYNYVFSMPAGGVTSGVASGAWDPALLSFDPPIYASGSFKSIKYKDTPIELMDNKIKNGIIKTKIFGDFIVLLHGYRLDDGRSAISFISTNENVIKLKKTLQIE